MLTRRKLIMGAVATALVGLGATPALARDERLLADILYGVSDALVRDYIRDRYEDGRWDGHYWYYGGHRYTPHEYGRYWAEEYHRQPPKKPKKRKKPHHHPGTPQSALRRCLLHCGKPQGRTKRRLPPSATGAQAQPSDSQVYGALEDA